MTSNYFILCHHLLLLPSIFPSIRVFSNESALHIRWPKYWNFSISPSNEYSGLISFRIDWFDLLVVQGISRVFSNTTIQSIKSSALSFLYSPTLTSIHDNWKTQFKMYVVGVGLIKVYKASLRLVRRALSIPLLTSMSEAISVHFHTLIKLCYIKVLE